MRLFLFLLFLPCLVACAPSQKHLDAKETTDLKPTLSDYHMKLKWGLWEQAGLYVTDSHREAFLGRHEELGEDYKIVAIEVKSVHFDGPRAEVESEREWYDEGMVVRKERFVEEWRLESSIWRRHESMKKDDWKKRFPKTPAEEASDSEVTGTKPDLQEEPEG